MNGVWYAAFGLVTLLSATTAVLLIATMRQVGVLHQRVRPTGPGEHEGPTIGSRLPRGDLEPVNANGAVPYSQPVTLLAYVTPGCGLCEDLARHVVAYRKYRPDDVDALLVTEMTFERATAWIEEHDIKAPLLRSADIMHRHHVPGSPYVVALLDDGAESVRVLATGVVNTLEQFEDLVVQADDNRRALEQEDDRAAFFTTQFEPAPPPVSANGNPQ